MPLAERATRVAPEKVTAPLHGRPAESDLRDRRDAYRVHIPASRSQPSIAIDSEEGLARGYLLDISRSGAGALLRGHFDVPVGSVVPCHIGLPDGSFSARTEVRSATTHRNHLRLGLLFTDLSVTDHTHIDAAIAKMERSLLRHFSYLRK